MEQIFTLDSGADRPILLLDDLFPGCTALIDTGALFPVWTKNSKLLEALGANLVKKAIEFGGFGGRATGDLYTLTLQLGDIIYPNMHIIACEDNDVPGFFIFSATMFKQMEYTIDDMAKIFKVVIRDNQICRNLTIHDSNGMLTVLCTTE